MTKINRQPSRSRSNRAGLQYGEQVGDYKILGVIGNGATSTVYKARNLHTGNEYALKILSNPEDPSKQERFWREMNIMVNLEPHRNVVRYERVIQDPENARIGVVMEYIDGLQLDEWQKRYQDELELDELGFACLSLGILRGVNHLHKNNIFHRDLKPANIMMAEEDGRYIPKIIDFGVARNAGEPISEEEKEKITGTPAYISPEEIQSPEKVDFGSDLYSLGIVIYETVCGQRPFQGPVSELFQAHVKQKPPKPSELNPKISEEFEAILMRLLAKDLKDRYREVDEVIGDLESYCRHLVNQEREESDPNSSGEQDPKDKILSSESVVAESESKSEPGLGRRETLVFHLQRVILALLAVLKGRTEEEPPKQITTCRLREEDETLSLDTSYTLHLDP